MAGSKGGSMDEMRLTLAVVPMVGMFGSDAKGSWDE